MDQKLRAITLASLAFILLSNYWRNWKNAVAERQMSNMQLTQNGSPVEKRMEQKLFTEEEAKEIIHSIAIARNEKKDDEKLTVSILKKLELQFPGIILATYCGYLLKERHEEEDFMDELCRFSKSTWE